jgi:hypothetical protein
MNFDRSFAGAQFISDLLIKQTGNNQGQCLATGMSFSEKEKNLFAERCKNPLNGTTQKTH